MRFQNSILAASLVSLTCLSGPANLPAQAPADAPSVDSQTDAPAADAGNAPAADTPANAATTVKVFDAGSIVVPSQFLRVKPQSKIVQHEFQVSSDDSEKIARITMMAAGGDIDANINRWKGQFSGGDEKSGTIQTKEVGEITVHLVDINGTFADSMGGGPFSGGRKVQRKDHAMTGAILQTKEGRKFFVKLVGPKGIVDANRKAFGEMIESIQK